MAVYRNVSVSFWNSPKVLDDMDCKSKLFYLYLLTNNATRQSGIYRISKNQMAHELGISVRNVTSLLKIFEEEFKVIKYNDKTHEIAIKNWGLYNFRRCGKAMLDCTREELKDVKDKSLIKFVGDKIEKEEIKKLYEMAYYEQNLDNEDKNFGNDLVNASSHLCRQEEEKEEEKEKEEEEKEEIQKEEDVVGKYAKIYTENVGFINAIVAQWLIEVSSKIDVELFKRAIEIATNKKKCNKGYIDGILRQWEKNNIKTIDDLNAYELEQKENRQLRELEEDESYYRKPSEEELAYARELSIIF